MYDPLSHPFDLPIQKLLAHCTTERPLFFPPCSGSTPGTTLAGAFGTALWSAACSHTCQDVQCQFPKECVVPWLYKPYSKAQHRHFARPVLLRSIELEGNEPVNTFTLEITLWGRHAIAGQEAVKKTLKKMGELGLNGDKGQVRFNISKIETTPSLTLAERIKTLPLVHSVLLEFQTPFLHQEKNEEGKREFYIGEDLPLVNILGNAAYNLAAWDMEDRKLSLEGQIRHNLARDARDVAWKIAKDLLVVRTHLSPVDIGKRYSRGNRQTMSLQGFVGLVELSGDLKSALPWLLVLALGGGGQKRAMGFGSVRLWLENYT